MAVMASEAPLDHMSFNEKAHPTTVPAEPITMDTDMNGNTNHYDALFEEESLTTNGTYLDETATPNHDILRTEPVASKTIAGDPIITSGISPVAPFLPMQNGDSVSDATDAPKATSISQAVEQPESNLRAEPPAQYQGPVEDPDAMEVGTGAGSTSDAELQPVQAFQEQEPVTQFISVEFPTTVDEVPAAQSPVDQDMTMKFPIAEPSAPQVLMLRAQMNTTEALPTAPVRETETVHETPLLIDEPMPTTETMPELEVPSVEPLFIRSAQTGQVRQREDDDEAEPVAKRARTETGEEALPTPAAEPTAQVAQASPAPAFSSALSPTSSTPSGHIAALLDSSPMTSVQHKYLLTNLRKAKKVKSAEWFLKPVDSVALNIPSYPQIVTQPMDLGTLEQKLKDNMYPTADAFMADFELIVSNSILFNGPTHPVSYTALNFKAYFVKVMSAIPKGTAAAAPPPVTALPKKTAAPPKAHRQERERERKAVAKSPVDKTAGFLDQHGMPIIRRDSSAQNDRPKREIHPPKRDLPAAGSRPKQKKHQMELKFCQHVMNEIVKKKHQSFAYPFMVPVDPVALNIPNYHKIIKKPMDFGTIQANLNSSQYSSANSFYNDANTVFQNCFKFNPATDEVHKMGKLLEAVFNQTWATKEQWLMDNAPASEPQSDEDEEEEDDEETAEDPSDAIRRMQEIQQQIAALSAEALKLTAVPKRTSPKASVPKRSKTSKPKRPSGTSHVAASKSSKSKIIKKPKKLTLDQKREVSEGIANLDEGQMRKAVQIIRNGVPELRNVQDDELELDIDEIPDDVVYQLYQFVKAKLPRSHRAPDPEPDYEDDDDEFEVNMKPSASSRKKNKPMKANEQEERIRTLQAQLEIFKGNSASEQSPPDHADSSDEDASESSEEE